jgi:hypothetical protein
MPSTQMSQIMQETWLGLSELFLSASEYIRNKNSTCDFWVSGCFVVIGIRPHQKGVIEQYICISRRQQNFFLPEFQDLYLRT